MLVVGVVDLDDAVGVGDPGQQAAVRPSRGGARRGRRRGPARGGRPRRRRRTARPSSVLTAAMRPAAARPSRRPWLRPARGTGASGGPRPRRGSRRCPGPAGAHRAACDGVEQPGAARGVGHLGKAGRRRRRGPGEGAPATRPARPTGPSPRPGAGRRRGVRRRCASGLVRPPGSGGSPPGWTSPVPGRRWSGRWRCSSGARPGRRRRRRPGISARLDESAGGGVDRSSQSPGRGMPCTWAGSIVRVWRTAVTPARSRASPRRRQMRCTISSPPPTTRRRRRSCWPR